MLKSNKIIDILIGGEAGQGLATVGSLLARSLASRGYEILATQTYLSRIRGGHNTYQIRAGLSSPRSPGEDFDLILALDRETIPLHGHRLESGGLVIGDQEIVDASLAGTMAVPFREMGPSRTMNVSALGVLTHVAGLPLDVVESEVRWAFSKAGGKILDDNVAALRAGYGWAEKQDKGRRGLPPPGRKKKRMLMTGNDAIALGALASGLKFCAYYPMTPATSIVLAVTRFSEAMGCVVEQAEDEISAVNMAVGASFAGAPSLVATSGGGFALMTEGVSLAGMTETPIVIAVAQRPGPATGLPTRTEQADLNLVLYAGHGEFPRAVLTPTSVEECFLATKRAFYLSEKYQTPVFVLTDQHLADSLATIPPLPAETGDAGPATADPAEVQAPYRRYALTQDGISPRLLPGFSHHLVRADSDEHNEEGVIEEDPANRILMHEKRLRKGAGMEQEVMEPHLHGGEGFQTLLVCWGSSRGAVEDCIDHLRSEGIMASSLSLPQVWPLPKSALAKWTQKAEKVIFVEGNATGQLARLVRAETGIESHGMITRYDGLALTTGYIVNALKGMI